MMGTPRAVDLVSLWGVSFWTAQLIMYTYNVFKDDHAQENDHHAR
jgi:hypothetical protein